MAEEINPPSEAKRKWFVKIKIRKGNIRRLASLSALGAGTLGMTTGTGEASTIVYSGILNDKIGFASG